MIRLVHHQFINQFINQFISQLIERLIGVWLILLVAMFAFGESQAQIKSEPPAQAGEIRARPLDEHCASPQSNNEAPATISALKEPDVSRRVRAAEQLGKGCDSRAIEPLLAARTDPDGSVRAAAVEALGRLGDPRTIEPLIESLADPDWRVRAVLGRALCSFQVYQSSNAVLNVLVNAGEKVTTEGDLRARCLGILAINQLRDVRFSRKAIGFLFRFLDDERESFRAIAEETALELKNTRNGYHELIGILKQNYSSGFRRKAAYWLGRLKIEEARAALTEASSSDPDAGVRRVASEALAGMKSQ